MPSTDTDAPRLVRPSTHNQVTTLTMDMPRRLNGWTAEMLAALRDALKEASDDPGTRAVILTGTDPYYSAGVNLSGAFPMSGPRALHAFLVDSNRQLFELFLHFDKPILAAVNGPAIGASVTTAVLCDAIIASEKATFSTPFAAIGLPAEGCSSLLFPRILGGDTAARILGEEGWKPTAAEALDIGLVQHVVAHDALLGEAQRIAEDWVETGRSRSYRGDATRETLDGVNAAESVRVADGFVSGPFLIGQARFLWSRKKRVPALLFLTLWLTRPGWALLL